MATNIYTQPITKTDTTVSTTVYTQEITVEKNGEITVEVLSFPQCLDEMTEGNRKALIQGILVNHLQNNL